MKIINERIFNGRNIYSHKKCIRIDLDLEGYSEIPTKDIPNFNYNLVKLIPELNKHRCGIDEEGGFVKRLEEGTYLAHVLEHTIIAIHNMLGMDVSYGKARVVKDELYYVIFQYEYRKTALAISRMAEHLINSLIKQNPIGFDDRLEYIKNILKEEIMGPSTMAICDAAKKYGLSITQLGNSGLYQMGYGKSGRVFEATVGHFTRCIGADISCDKILTKEILQLQCIPVAEGYKVYNTIQLLKEAENIGYPLVLKPQYGNKGKGVILNIKNEKQLLKAYKKISEEFKEVVVEKYVEGKDFRVCVVNYKVVAVALRVPPYLVGDGKRTVRELIKEINSDSRRGECHEKPLTKIKIDETLLEYLDGQGLSINSIPLKGEKVILRENANLSTGGWSEDYTDEICDENKEICVRVAKALGLDICGVDICTEDISKPLYNNGVVIEVNAAPGIRMHHHPMVGKSRNVADNIVNLMYNNNPKDIPIISVTGTNGKTTTTRLIGYVMSLIGYNVGMTTTSGIFLGEKCIDCGDDTGAESAKTVLLNPDVDVAVLETARGGIIRKGLAYDMSDVGILTNVTEDHLGIDEIETLEDLSYVKSLVLEAIKPNGYAVINANDFWSLKIISRIKVRKIFFSSKGLDDLLLENIQKGDPVVYSEDGCVYVQNNGKKYTICREEEIAISLGGKLRYNIENALAAIAGLVGLGVDYCIITKGLREFSLNEKHNPGRFNEYDLNGTKVILDYGHNLDGYKAVISSMKNMNFKNIIGVIGVPGDRNDDFVSRIGELSGEFFDYVVIKEDKEKRGREIGEIASILEKGVKRTLINKNNSKIILDEVEALEFALIKAKPGDGIIVFFEKYQRLVEYIKEVQLAEIKKQQIAQN